jgi:hypothetical protein
VDVVPPAAALSQGAAGVATRVLPIRAAAIPVAATETTIVAAIGTTILAEIETTIAGVAIPAATEITTADVATMAEAAIALVDSTLTGDTFMVVASGLVPITELGSEFPSAGATIPTGAADITTVGATGSQLPATHPIMATTTGTVTDPDHSTG